jgi:hypothetical protein
LWFVELEIGVIGNMEISPDFGCFRVNPICDWIARNGCAFSGVPADVLGLPGATYNAAMSNSIEMFAPSRSVSLTNKKSIAVSSLFAGNTPR